MNESSRYCVSKAGDERCTVSLEERGGAVGNDTGWEFGRGGEDSEVLGPKVELMGVGMRSGRRKSREEWDVLTSWIFIVLFITQ